MCCEYQRSWCRAGIPQLRFYYATVFNRSNDNYTERFVYRCRSLNGNPNKRAACFFRRIVEERGGLDSSLPQLCGNTNPKPGSPKNGNTPISVVMSLHPSTETLCEPGKLRRNFRRRPRKRDIIRLSNAPRCKRASGAVQPTPRCCPGSPPRSAHGRLGTRASCCRDNPLEPA